MSLEFKLTIKSINIASEDLTKITLEVKNGSLDGKYDTEDITFADEQTEEPQNEEIAQNNDKLDVLNQESANSSKDSQNATDEILEPNKEAEEIGKEEPAKETEVESPEVDLGEDDPY